MRGGKNGVQRGEGGVRRGAAVAEDPESKENQNANVAIQSEAADYNNVTDSSLLQHQTSKLNWF